jgi:hypothetical protein
VVIDGLVATGGVTGVHIDGTAPFDGKVLISDFRTAELSGNAILDDSGDADVQLIGFVGRYTGQAAAVSPIRVNVVDASPGSYLLEDITVLRLSTSSPNGLINVQDASPALPVTIGQVKWDLGATFPDLSPSSTGTLTTTELKFRV